MSPSAERDPTRRADQRPTIAEVAALTRRLRELSTPGRHADPAERAAFLADKEALLARIAESDTAAAERDAEFDADADGDADGTAAGWSR